MRRDTLEQFFRRLVLVTLPLAAACGGSPSGGGGFCSGQPSEENVIVDGGFADGDVVTDTDLGYTQLDPNKGSALCKSWCKPTLPNCTLLDASVSIVTCGPPLCLGRRPEGLQMPEPDSGDELGAWLATCAHLEAASVPAFRTLATELRSYGAPDSLIAACERAARDEVRHARMTTRLARRHGAEPARVELDHAEPRDLLALALDNAVEGCVREAFGALVALWQAHTAVDREVRALAADIAPDEVQHAELAWTVARFIEPQLSATERSRIDDARHAALDELLAETARTSANDVVTRAGLPTGAAGAALVRALAGEVLRRERACA